MNDGDHGDRIPVDPVDQPMVADDELSDRRISEFGHDTSKEGVRGEVSRLAASLMRALNLLAAAREPSATYSMVA
jgi:hypothetical protein